MPVKTTCKVCHTPLVGRISREIDRSRENTLCAECYAAVGMCECGCGETFPLYNGHGQRRRFFAGSCHYNIQELRERARERRSETMRKMWATPEYRSAQDGTRSPKATDERRARNKAYWRKYYERTKEKRKVMAGEYARKHCEQRAETQERRRARQLGNNPDLTPIQWKAVVESYDHRCAYCGKKFARLTMDHIIPFAKGGRHTMGNVVPACRSCNSHKHTSEPPVPVQPVML